MDDRRLPTVSVIVPVFNAEAYLAQAVSSALDSRGVDIEVLVVDDQSTDGTWDLLGAFGDAIRRVRQPKGGPYRARNLAASMARGDWLAFLDADDEWTPDKLARQLAIADDRTALVYTDCLNIGDTSRVKPRQSDSVRLHEGDVFEPLLLGNFISLSSVLIRTAAFRQLGGFSETHTGVQDWDLWLRLAATGASVRLVRDPLTRYRHHSGQMSLVHDRRAADRLAVLRQAIDSPRGRQVSRRVVRRSLANVWELGAWQISPSSRWTALMWYVRAARYWPWSLEPYRGVAKCCLGRV